MKNEESLNYIHNVKDQKKKKKSLSRVHPWTLMGFISDWTEGKKGIKELMEKEKNKKYHF